MRFLERLFHPAHLWDLFVTSDPDLGRLRMGLRSALSAALAALVLTMLARWLGEPPTVPMVGALVAMMGSQLATDAEPRAQRLTTLFLLFPALASVVLGTLTSQVPLLGAVAFAVTIFLATFVRRFGHRGLALGMMGFMSFFISLFFHAQLAQVPALLGAVVSAIGIAYTVRFVLIRDRPDRDLQRFLRTFQKTVAIVLWELTKLLERPRLTRSLPRRLRREADRLNDAALAVEDLLARCQPALRLRVFDLELATDRVIGAVQQVMESGALGPGARKEVRAALVAARVAVRERDPAALRLMQQHFEHLREQVSGSPDPERGQADARRFRTSLTDLVEAAAHLPDEAPRLSSCQVTAPSVDAALGEEPPRNGLHPATRQAIQVTVASVLAMVAGYAVSTSRWYWAVIATFVIFTRTKTLGDTLLRAWSRVLGTLLGVMAGLVLAGLISGHRVLELTTLFVCIFFGFYLIRVSYAWMVFWLTMQLSVLYSLLGHFTPGLLYLRIEETVIGAGIGVVIATLLLPERTTVHIQTAAKQVLSAVREYLEEAVVKRSSEDNPARLLDLARTLDARLRDLRAAAYPLTGGLVRVAPRTSRAVHSVSELVLFVRHLALGRGLLAVHDSVRELMREAGARLASNAYALSRALNGEEAPDFEPASALIERAQRSLTGDETLRRGPASPPILLHWLARVDDTLTLLARTLGPLLTSPLPRRARV